MSIMGLRFERANAPLTTRQEIGRGGQGAIWSVSGSQDQVAKIYHKPTHEDADKLKVMVDQPPTDPTRPQHVSIAWPTDRILDATGRCVGFVMPFVNQAKGIQLLKLYNPQDRLRTAPDFTWHYLLSTASNLASVIHALHSVNYVVGDLNESNVMVAPTALVTMVDCDSIQVPNPAGGVFRCPVGKSEYTAPELQGVDFHTVDRGPQHDNFALAVLIFMLLMEGVHPFDAVWSGPDPVPSREQRIRQGLWPYGSNHQQVSPPRHALSFAILPDKVRELMVRCFVDGQATPTSRPLAQQWQQALVDAQRDLVTCTVNSHHVYSPHLSSCPWCGRMRQGLPDPFPLPGHQVGLPPVAINPVSSHPVARPTQQGVPRTAPAASPWATGTYSPAARAAGGGRAWGCMAISTLLVLGVVGVLLANAALGSALRGGSGSTTSSQSNTGASTTTIIYQNSLTAYASDWEPDQNCFFASDGFHIKPNLACQSPVRGQGDVDVSVQMRQISGAPTDLNGIEVRRIGDPASLYEFDIAATGGWLFKICIRSFANCTVLARGSDPAIRTGQGAVNTVEVRAVGSHFALLVNGTQVGQADDTSLASGDVWLDSDGSSECVFTNFVATRPT